MAILCSLFITRETLISVVVPCFGFGNGSGIFRLMTGNICQPCDSDTQCLGDAYLGYCNPKLQFNSTNENAESYSQCVIRTLLASGSHLPSRQGKCQVRTYTPGLSRF